MGKIKNNPRLSQNLLVHIKKVCIVLHLLVKLHVIINFVFITWIKIKLYFNTVFLHFLVVLQIVNYNYM